MQTLTKTLLLLLLIPSICFGIGMQAVIGNLGTISGMTSSEECTPFADETSVVAYWDFENDWNNQNSSLAFTPVNSPTFDSVTPIEDSYSASFSHASTEYAKILDADCIAAGLPMTGTNTTFTLLIRFRADTVGYMEYIVSKYAVTGDKRTLGIVIQANGTLSINHGVTGGTGYTQLNNIATITAGDDYGLAYTENGSNANYTVHLYNLTDSEYVTTIGVESTATWPNTLYVSSAELRVGGRDGSTDTFNGEIDDFVMADIVWDANQIHEYFTTLCAPPAVDVTAPELSTAVLGENGETLTLSFNEPVSYGAGGAAGWTATWSVSGATTYTYSSGSGTSTILMTGDNTIDGAETVTDGLDYTQPTNGWEDLAGNDLVTIADKAITNNAGGEAYYVAQNEFGTGTGSSYGNSMSVATFNAGSWSPGDTFYFSGQITTPVVVPSSGSSAGGYITLDGYETNNTTDVVGGDSTAGFAYFDGVTMPIDVSDQDYIIVRDFRVTDWDGGTGGYAIGGWDVDHIKVLNNHIHDGLSGCDRGIAFLSAITNGNTNIYVEDNYINGVNDSSSVGMGTGGSNITGMVIRHNKINQAVDSIAFEIGKNILIENNSLLDKDDTYGEDHIDLKHGCENVVVRYNIMKDPTPSGAGTYGYSGIQVQRGADHVYVYGNWIEGNYIGIYAYGGANDTPSYPDTYDVYGWSNVIFDNFIGIQTLSSAQGDVTDVGFVNNTIVDNIGGISSASAGAYIGSSDSIFIQNNIFLNNRGTSGYHQVYYGAGANGITHTYNIGYYTGQTATVYDSSTVNFESYSTNNVRQDPNLTNYMPTAASTYVNNTGTTISDSVLPDFAGKITIDGETYCNNDGGTCDNLLSFDVALDPTTDWTTTPPTVVTALQSDEGAAPEKGAYVYDQTSAGDTLLFATEFDGTAALSAWSGLTTDGYKTISGTGSSGDSIFDDMPGTTTNNILTGYDSDDTGNPITYYHEIELETEDGYDTLMFNNMVYHAFSGNQSARCVISCSTTGSDYNEFYREVDFKIESTHLTDIATTPGWISTGAAVENGSFWNCQIYGSGSNAYVRTAAKYPTGSGAYNYASATAVVGTKSSEVTEGAYDTFTIYDNTTPVTSGWHTLGWYYKRDATNGVVKIWLDGTLLVHVTGDTAYNVGYMPDVNILKNYGEPWTTDQVIWFKNFKFYDTIK